VPCRLKDSVAFYTQGKDIGVSSVGKQLRNDIKLADDCRATQDIYLRRVFGLGFSGVMDEDKGAARFLSQETKGLENLGDGVVIVNRCPSLS